MILPALILTCLVTITTSFNPKGSTQIQNPLNYGIYTVIEEEGKQISEEYHEDIEYPNRRHHVIFPGEIEDGENNYIPKIEVRDGVTENSIRSSTKMDYVNYQLPEGPKIIETTTTVETTTRSRGNRKSKGRNNRKRKDENERRKKRRNRKNRRKDDDVDNVEVKGGEGEGDEGRRCRRRQSRHGEDEEKERLKNGKRRQHNKHGKHHERKRRRGDDHHHHHEHHHS